jgi:hypothetical protein
MHQTRRERAKRGRVEGVIGGETLLLLLLLQQQLLPLPLLLLLLLLRGPQYR